MQHYKWNQNSGRLGQQSSFSLMPTPSWGYSERESVVVVLTFCPTTLCLATHVSAILANFGPKMTNSTMLGLVTQIEGDDGCWRSKLCGSSKFSAKSKRNHSKNCWSSGSSLLFCRVLDFNGILGTPCPSAWKRRGKRRRETGDDRTYIMDGIKIEWVRATQTHWVARLVCWRRPRQLTPSPWRSSTGDLTT